MTIKELKEKIKNVPDDYEIYIDYEYPTDDGYDYQEEHEVVNTDCNSAFKEFHLFSYFDD